MLSEAQCRSITQAFYGRFCGADPTAVTPGVHLTCTEERNAVLPGYGRRFTIYALARENSLAMACVPQYAPFLERRRGKTPDEILAALERTYPIAKRQLMVFQQERLSDFGTARALYPSDYPQFEAFFRIAHPGAAPDGWLQAYFAEKSGRGILAGSFADGKLVSVADAPDMPYLPDRIQHTGITTLPDYRRRGYGTWAAGLAVHRLLEQGICPQWECGADNTASMALAEKIGFRKYGIAYILEKDAN